MLPTHLPTLMPPLSPCRYYLYPLSISKGDSLSSQLTTLLHLAPGDPVATALKHFLAEKPSHAYPDDFDLLCVSSPWLLYSNSLLDLLLTHNDHSLSPSHHHPQSGSSVFPCLLFGLTEHQSYRSSSC